MALWPPGPGHWQSAVAPIGRVGPGPGIWSAWTRAWTRQAQSPGGLSDRGRGDSLLEAAWSRQFIYVYSFMRIRHLGFFLIDLLSDYKTDRHFSLGSRSYGFVAIISGISPWEAALMALSP